MLAASNSEAMASLLLHHEVEQFLYAEAQMLDDGRFDDWLGLLDPGIRYWMPTRTNRLRRQEDRSISSADEVAHFDEDFASLSMRVRRMTSGAAWTEQPASRCRRLVTNVSIARETGVISESAQFEVSSNLLLHQNRDEDETASFVARRTDRLHRTESGLLILARTILLDQSVILSKSLSTFF